MKISDYIVDFLIQKKVTDVFGYPGGMVTHLMESFSKRADEIVAHINYHEQASAFAACGYAQAGNGTGVAYATSGPGATNLITGVCNAYYDSTPVLFITGQVNVNESKGNLGVRQKGFQETDIVSMVQNVTKYSAYIDKPEDIRFHLEKAWYFANEGRKGPVLLDIPMNIFRSDVNLEQLKSYEDINSSESHNIFPQMESLEELLHESKRPVILIGAGVKIAGVEERLCKLLKTWNIPVVSSMLAVDVMSIEPDLYFGFVGAYGMREANFIVAKSDLVISLGSRLDIRQTGVQTSKFAGEAKLVRVDIDHMELSNHLKADEIHIECGMDEWLDAIEQLDIQPQSLEQWISVCYEIRNNLENLDATDVNRIISRISQLAPSQAIITTDVGQNQVWIAQSFRFKKGQKVLFSGGHGSMGYSLPAAIGAYFGSRKPVISFQGDGGFQMNMQELQFLVREKIPVTVILVNNYSLGMIRHFQEMYFDNNNFQTVENGGYSVPNFEKIANAYEIPYFTVKEDLDLNSLQLVLNGPQFIEIQIDKPTYVFPKLEFGKSNQDQEPSINRELFDYLMEL